MKANYKDKIKSTETTSEVSLGNLYEMNQQLMSNEPAATEAEIQLAKEHLRAWLTHNFLQKYFMLLCHDLRDYTLFNLDKTDTWKIAQPKAIFSAANDILECMSNRGEILAIEEQDGNTWEIWIRNDEGCFAYYLFPYGEAVLEY
jgi:hypothetical protein